MREPRPSLDQASVFSRRCGTKDRHAASLWKAGRDSLACRLVGRSPSPGAEYCKRDWACQSESWFRGRGDVTPQRLVYSIWRGPSDRPLAITAARASAVTL